MTELVSVTHPDKQSKATDNIKQERMHHPLCNNIEPLYYLKALMFHLFFRQKGF
ncbi:hypothetical protein PAUR_a3321 [Pseudoalteromonas aurantia 208]|uniref:Orphan protein n=1 Tax=Pseudoalteromonas aurantia 208 TaxID=1314867 RepID=A0ABR9E7Y5_9GAMM|nr:hypothetical protein [Pseudoalteromonas aurantia 208]